MASTDQNIVIESPTMQGLSSDESFAAPTSVDGADIVLSGNATSSKLVDNLDQVEDRLKSDATIVREKFRENMSEERKEYLSAEQRQADLLQIGYANALDWLENKRILDAQLTAINLNPATDDVALIGQIAKLQLGSWSTTSDGKTSWRVPSRRDERLARFYRIFLADRAKWKPDMIADLVLATKGKSGGVLSAAKPKPVKADQKEVEANLRQARRAQPIARVRSTDTTHNWGKPSEYLLVLARVDGNDLELCQIVEGQKPLTEKLRDAYAAEAALTVPSEAA